MAVPILIEPTCLAFTLVHGQIEDEKEELKEFSKFIIGYLEPLFDELKKGGGKIAVTAEILDYYEAAVPISAYYDTSIARLARETFGLELLQLAKVVHEFGGHSYNVDFNDSFIDIDSKLLNEDIYSHWKDLAALFVLDSLPRWVLKSRQRTIFPYEKAVLNLGCRSESIKVTDSLNTIFNSSDFLTNIFFENIKYSSINIDSIPCSGTGTHSSMWDKKIDCIMDIDRDHRCLFMGLLSLGIVKRVTFSDFPQRSGVVFPPRLELDSVEMGSCSDTIKCTLRGHGAKANSQFLYLNVVSGYGDLMCRAFDGIITLEKLAQIEKIYEAAATK